MSRLDNTALEGSAEPAPRLPALDVARGLAVLAMVAYHTAWDLSTLALADLDVVGARGWNLFARSIAASFLVLAGVGLTLAHRRAIRWRAYARRLGVIAAAAAAVTLATVFAFPRSWIFFGILHNMALSSVVALPFLRLPAPLAALAGLALLALPHVVPTGGVLDAPALAILGLGRLPPNTHDWVPILPWTGYVLAGIGVAPLLAPALPRGSGGRPGRALARIGRHSLLIYLVHQPLIFGALYGLRQVTGPHPAAGTSVFMRDCGNLFRQSGHEEEASRATCACTLEALRRDGSWPAIRDGSAGPEVAQRAGDHAAACLRQSGGETR